MSVKDKIAMWNSMANNSHTPPPQNHKLVASDTAPNSKQQEKEKKIAVEPSAHSTGEPKAPPNVGMALNFKKTESTDHPTAAPVEQTLKAANLAQKPKETVKSTETAQLQKKEVQGGKFNDIKKQLQQQTAGKGIYFAPQPPKKVEIPPVNSGGVECQIEKEIPKFNVKEQAAKLAQFYLQKQLNDRKKQEDKHEEKHGENTHIAQEKHGKEQQNTENVAYNKQQTNNCLNISLDQNLPPASAYPEKGEADIKAAEDGSGVDMKLRVAKNKKKREQFDSDED